MDEMQQKPVWQVLLLVFLSTIAGLFFGNAIGLIAGALFYSGDNYFTAIFNPTADMKVSLMVMQGFTSLLGFFLFPLFTWARLRGKGLSGLNNGPLRVVPMVIVFFLVIAFGIVDSVIIEWNQNIHLPEAFKTIEEWARNSEDNLEALTKMLTQFNSPSEFILALVVIAVVAGIAEEFLFRGILQTEFYRGTGNIHIAIWSAAILFSAIHVQFFGFVPRVLLGALFGYLYYWSGNLYVSMFAHFINNGFSVVAIYLNQLKVSDLDVESGGAAPWPLVGAAALAVVALLLYFKRYFEQTNNTLT